MHDIKDGDERWKLDNYLFAYRITPSVVTSKTPAEQFLGRNIKSRFGN